MKRLFFALWPNEKTREEVVGLSESIISNRLKAVKPDNFHVTLVFMGAVNESTEQLIRKRMSHIIAKPMRLIFDQLTLWPKGGILSLTSLQQPQSLIDLVEQVKRVVEETGIELDSRPYVSHITLARGALSRPSISIEPICWQATDFALVESVSTADGVDYRVIERWPLTL